MKAVHRLLALVLTGIFPLLFSCGGDDGGGGAPPPTDTTPPTVLSTNPANGATGVAINIAPSAAFSEAMDGATINTTTFVVSTGSTNISGSVSYFQAGSAVTATFTPSANLANNTTYTATITTGAKDLAGNPLAANVTWSFTTAATADITPPTVVSTNPGNGATNVADNTSVSATFSEAMNAATINTTTFTISAGGANVTGTVSYSGVTATFIPSANLVSNTVYTATITTGAKDVAGNPVSANVTWSFTTAAAPPAQGANKVVFVSSVKGNGNLSTWADAGGKTGLAAGDAICQARANAAGLTGTFVAWLSDGTSDAYCRIHNLTGKKSSNCGQASLPVAAGPWVRTDGFPFSEAIDQLVDNDRVYVPIRFDESGNSVASTSYFTATTTNGSLHPNDVPSPCSDWTSGASGVFVTTGDTNGVSSLWTTSGGSQCSANLPLVCFQTGSGPALPAFASAGKKAFLSSATGNGNLGSWPDAGGKTGLAAGDAICQARAAGAGLANASNFKAWLSDSSTDALNRITSNGPWVRLDGVKVADTKADLIDGFLFTSLSLTETGIYRGNFNVWTGTIDTGTRSCPCCTNWTDGTNAVKGFGGNSSRAGLGWSLQFEPDCDFTFSHLFCLED